MTRKEKLEFLTSGASWLAVYDGKVIGETELTRGEKPPKLFVKTIKQFVKEKLKKVI